MLKIIQNYDEIDEPLINIEDCIYEILKNYNSGKKELSNMAKFLLKRINESDNRASLSCRKLAKDYQTITGNKVGKSTVNNILRKELGLKYLKTTFKNNYLNREPGILDCLCFIKIIQKCMKLGFRLIFLDESKIETTNNHYRCWRYKNETIYFGNKKNEKSNLLLAIEEDKVIHYSLTQENTNSEIFLEFMKELVKKLKLHQTNKYILIMDNLSSHKKGNVIKFFVDEKLNVLFNAPYNSVFNSVELSFRSIKKITYSKLYQSIEEVKKDIINYLESDEISQIIKKYINETLMKYIAYSERNKYVNLNNFDSINII